MIANNSHADGTGAVGDWTLELRPRDPILVRDARPFAADPGARAVTLDWPLPSTIAGALRTHIGNEIGAKWDQGGQDDVRKIGVAGPFLLRRNAAGQAQVYFPAPRDAVPYRNEAYEQELLRLRPLPQRAPVAGAGCDLWPGLRPVRVEREVKPAAGEAFWSRDELAAWLGDARSTTVPEDTRQKLPTDVRTHVAIAPETQTSREGALFSTEALAFDPRRGEDVELPAEAMLCRLSDVPAAWRRAPAFLPLGGERRQVELAEAPDAAVWPQPPPDLIRRLTGTKRLRLLLATPALFARSWADAASGAVPPGWLPEWIDVQTLQGTPPLWLGADWTLVSAVVGRRVPLSGWDLRHGRPKRTRYAVPAGSVYFFALDEPLTAVEARALWLYPVADRLYDRNNGFGLALPGIWEAWEKEEPQP